MNAVVYCRVSSDIQEKEGTSLESQREACVKKARELGYSVPPDYIFLEAWPGPDLDRPQLTEVRTLIKERRVDCLIFYALDRLSRTPIHQAIIIDECDRAHVKVYSATEDIENSPEGKLINYVRGYAAELERAKIMERTQRGKREKVKQGHFATAGPALYGYDVVGERGNRRRVVNPDEAEVIRRIFGWFAFEGCTLHKAEVELNRMKLTGRKGRPWSQNTVYHLITNPAYKGETWAYRYQLVEPKKPAPGPRKYRKTTHVIRDEKDWVLIPGVTPAIVDAATWEAAQAQLERNKATKANKRCEYLFSGEHIFCGVCGHAMSGSVKKKPRGDVRYYRCACNSHPLRFGKCPMPIVQADFVEAAVWDELVKRLRTPEAVTSGEKSAVAVAAVATFEAEMILAENTMKRLLNEEQRILQLYARGVVEESAILPELERIKARKTEAKARLETLRDDERRSREDAERQAQTNKAKADIAGKIEGANYQTKRYAVEALALKVVVFPDRHIELRGNL